MRVIPRASINAVYARLHVGPITRSRSTGTFAHRITTLGMRTLRGNLKRASVIEEHYGTVKDEWPMIGTADETHTKGRVIT